MADNYLERKMEDYRSGRTAPRRLTHTGDAPGILRVKLQPHPVLVYDACGIHDETLISMLTGAGFKVAFTAADAAWGRSLAQRVGALFLPSPDGAEELVQKRWGKVHVWHSCGKPAGSPLSYALHAIADLTDDER